MKELEIIELEINRLHLKAKEGPLDQESIRKLETLIKSKVLLTSKSTPIEEDNPFDGWDADTLKKLHAQIGAPDEH